MDLGIPINSTVEKAIQIYRARRHRVHSLRLVDREIMALKNKGLNQLDDICLWKRENREFKTYFKTSHTWNLVRNPSPKVSWEVWIGTIKHLAGHGEVYEWDRVLRIVEKGLHKRSSTVLLRYCFQAVAYAIWHERNVRRVGEASQPATCLIAKLDKLIRNRISSLRRRVGGKYEKMMEDWFDRD
ncbi:PREDICTED: uncharacterized protein LOC106303324 [Brassica oleracea var. oleracea]|uniref:uncharacterized protein LOC106303324 n=1 Tax=Brassica oleracea var. oleracea TaxID=109376 RepID=UPI0006A70360|nr:PREDICTED: uncharacterized protein LOC106303324 [Brassica oleracea var. oleracea]